MKVRGAELPEQIWVRNVQNGEGFVRLRQNIIQKPANISDEYQHIFEWDEVEIRIVDRDNLLGYVQKNFDELFMYGIAEEAKPKPKTAEELRDEQINGLQQENHEMNEMIISLYEILAGGE